MTVFMVALAASAQDTISVYLSDDDPTGLTNIRNKPMGAKVMQLSSDDIYIFSLTSPQDGWWKIVELWTVEDDVTDSLAGSDTGEYWVHYSVLGIGTRNYGQNEKLPLRSEPSKRAAVSYTLKGEQTVHPIDVKGSWVKVKTADGKGQGWVEDEWLCSNPLTTCP